MCDFILFFLFVFVVISETQTPKTTRVVQGVVNLECPPVNMLMYLVKYIHACPAIKFLSSRYHSFKKLFKNFKFGNI